VLIVCSSSIQTARMIAGIAGRAGLVCRSEGNPSVLPSGRFQPLPIGTRLGSPCFSSGAEPAWTGSAPVPRGFRPTAGNSRPEAAGQRASGLWAGALRGEAITLPPPGDSLRRASYCSDIAVMRTPSSPQEMG
jgi:hypothetical protein